LNYARAVRAVPHLRSLGADRPADRPAGPRGGDRKLKKRRRGVFRAVPVPPELLDTLDMVHGIREAQRAVSQFEI
jgi:hypothetical protein